MAAAEVTAQAAVAELSADKNMNLAGRTACKVLFV